METKTVMMPRELTAENGAKAAMSGEFKIDVEMHCTACDPDEPDEGCDVCCGDLTYIQPVDVPWTTIKEIYKLAVNLFGT